MHYIPGSLEICLDKPWMQVVGGSSANSRSWRYLPYTGVFVLNLLFSNGFILHSNLKFPVVRLSVLLDTVKANFAQVLQRNTLTCQ